MEPAPPQSTVTSSPQRKQEASGFSNLKKNVQFKKVDGVLRCQESVFKHRGLWVHPSGAAGLQQAPQPAGAAARTQEAPAPSPVCGDRGVRGPGRRRRRRRARRVGAERDGGCARAAFRGASQRWEAPVPRAAPLLQAALEVPLPPQPRSVEKCVLAKTSRSTPWPWSEHPGLALLGKSHHLWSTLKEQKALFYSAQLVSPQWAWQSAHLTSHQARARGVKSREQAGRMGRRWRVGTYPVCSLASTGSDAPGRHGTPTAPRSKLHMNLVSMCG
ncbi:PREDICTED: uncharacterized protein LOC102012123 [Chinchilla lanigera]|uniref:uncharacterized protein LOC102012123 n=1 Tax=Chinchilla lanigera TaxID=34839 RepID=UPI000696E44A|nr:PREDICTED: uncharacterized protein LOC102012123 [Chinchilla lanigera]